MKRYMSLAQIVRLFICLFAVLLVGMLGIFHFSYERSSEQEARQFAEKSLEESARMLADRMDDVITIMQSIAYEGGGSDFCVRGHRWRNENQQYIRTQLNQLALDSSIVHTAILYTQDGAYCTAANVISENPHLLYKRLDEEIGLSTPFRRVRYSAPAVIQGNVLVSVAIPMWSQSEVYSLYDGFCGVVVAQVNLLNLLDQVNVTTRPLKLAFGTPQVLDTLTRSLLDADEAGLDARMLRSELASCGWTLYHTDVTHNQSASMKQMARFTLVIGALMLVLHVAFIHLFQRMVVMPIESLARNVRHSTTGSVDIGEDIRSRNELVLLTHSINEMLERIRRDGEEQTQRLRERAVFMQARINPHFLYNNLECIRGMAAMQQYGAIRELTGVMADIYRYCNHSDPCVTLREELNCARQYFKLLSLRYPERLFLQEETEEAALDCRVPRMCLQPLMENSIYHGVLEARRAQGRMVLRARMEADGLHITLADDGCGMSEAQYAQANSLLPADDYAVKHIGIRNVRSRLRLLCGESSALTLYPAREGGVCAELFVSTQYVR